MRTVCIGHGMKMYLDRVETRAWVSHVAAHLGARGAALELFFFPQFPFLADVQDILARSRVGYGGQTMGPAPRGAFTGEVSVDSLVELGCRYVELGHSERRGNCGETDELVNQKVRLALGRGLHPVVCVGETREQRPEVQSFLPAQVQAVLDGIDESAFDNVILAYEPRWAIGQSSPAGAGYVQDMHALIRGTVKQERGREAADRIRIIYGGSVDLDAAPHILNGTDVDGLFIGRAALDPAAYLRFVEIGEGRS